MLGCETNKLAVQNQALCSTEI